MAGMAGARPPKVPNCSGVKEPSTWAQKPPSLARVAVLKPPLMPSKVTVDPYELRSTSYPATAPEKPTSPPRVNGCYSAGGTFIT